MGEHRREHQSKAKLVIESIAWKSWKVSKWKVCEVKILKESIMKLIIEEVSEGFHEAK